MFSFISSSLGLRMHALLGLEESLLGWVKGRAALGGVGRGLFMHVLYRY